MLAAMTVLSIYAWTLLDTGNPILDPIFGFFNSIWAGLGSMWSAFTGALGHWFDTVMGYTYAGIPVGPLILIGVGILSFFMLWGFIKVKQLFSDE